MQSAAQVMIGSLGATAGHAVAANGDGRRSLTGNSAPEGQAGDHFGRVVLDRMGRIALEHTLRAILTLAKEPSKPKIPRREGRRLAAAGRHQSLPRLTRFLISADTEGAGASQGVNFAEQAG